LEDVCECLTMTDIDSFFDFLQNDLYKMPKHVIFRIIKKNNIIDLDITIKLYLCIAENRKLYIKETV